MRVLLVDDDPAHRLLARRELRAIFPETEVIEATNISDALAAANPSGPALTLALVDLNLDGHDGTEVVLGLRMKLGQATCPIIQISTSDLETDIWRAYASGVACYLFKSADPSEYRANLRKAVSFLLEIRNQS